MSDEQKGAARAAGAFEAFISQMRQELDDKNRSMEYRLNFWAGIYEATEAWRHDK
jgi:hypothetical protein